MPSAALLPVLVLVVVFLTSGVAKLRAPHTVEAAFRDLQVPAVLDRRWIRSLFPWAEAVLAALLLVAPWPLAPVAALAAVVLCCAYWLLVRRALGFEEPVSCGCFGEASTEPVGPRTLWRNTLLLLLALLWLAASCWTSAPRLLLGLPAGGWLWLLGTVLACLVAVLSTGRGAGADQGSGAPAPPTDEEGEYLRQPIPGMMVRTAAGQWTSLQALARTRAVLLVNVSPGCGPCTVALKEAADWRHQLGPLVELLFLTTQPAEHVHALVPEEFWEGMLYDPEDFSGPLLGLGGTPSAVLLGADGLLAGGPVHGLSAVQEFVQEIAAELAAAEA